MPTTSTSFRTDPETLSSLDAVAKGMGRSRNWVLNQAVRDFLETPGLVPAAGGGRHSGGGQGGIRHGRGDGHSVRPLRGLVDARLDQTRHAGPGNAIGAHQPRQPGDSGPGCGGHTHGHRLPRPVPPAGARRRGPGHPGVGAPPPALHLRLPLVRRARGKSCACCTSACSGQGRIWADASLRSAKRMNHPTPAAAQAAGVFVCRA